MEGIEGSEHDVGITYRAIEQMFKQDSYINEKHNIQHSFQISIVEIYNEKIYNLLENPIEEVKISRLDDESILKRCKNKQEV